MSSTKCVDLVRTIGESFATADLPITLHIETDEAVIEATVIHPDDVWYDESPNFGRAIVGYLAVILYPKPGDIVDRYHLNGWLFRGDDWLRPSLTRVTPEGSERIGYTRNVELIGEH